MTRRDSPLMAASAERVRAAEAKLAAREAKPAAELEDLEAESEAESEADRDEVDREDERKHREAEVHKAWRDLAEWLFTPSRRHYL